ncbi:MAG: DinB family protein [Gemmataceae bacterium]|nr:DinB family protein [Gemmataceae bacterium]
MSLADEYLKGAADLRAAVAGMTPEQMAARPVPGKWSTLEVLCHLADFEPVFADRMKRVIALGDNPVLLAADENLFARELRYEGRDAAEEVAVVEATRRQMARILRGLPAEAFGRTGTHSLKGPQTLEQIARYAINHVNHHLPFIAEKRKALGV